MDGNTVASLAIIVGFLLTFAKYLFRNRHTFEGQVWPWTLHRYYRRPGVILHWLGWVLVVAGLAWKFAGPGA